MATTTRTKATAEDWVAFADTYTKLTKGTTEKPIGVILERLNALLPFSGASGFLDNGSGPATIVSRLIQDYGSSIPPWADLTCSDWAPAMIEQVQRIKASASEQSPESLWNRVEAKLLDAMDLNDIKTDSESHVAAGWVLYSTKDPQKCLAESKRVLQPDGVLAVSTWHDIQWLKVQRPLHKLRPDVKALCLPEGWDTESALKKELEKAGFRDVETHLVPVEVAYQTYDVLAEVLTTRVPHIVARTSDFTDEERETLKKMIVEETRALCPTEPGALKGFAIKHPNIKLVYGDLDDAELLETEASKADIVCHFADATHEPSIRALIRGLARRDASQSSYLIHTTISGILLYHDVVNGKYGESSDNVYNDLDGLSEVIDLPDFSGARRAEIATRNAGVEHGAHIKTGIVCLSTVYGIGRGVRSYRSVSIHELARSTLVKGHGIQVNNGKAA
ncbi:nucleoside-diphosphate-sugar epimerase [Seiridium cupressi]